MFSTKVQNVHGRLNVLENTTEVLEKGILNDLQALKSRINGHNKNINTLDQNLQIYVTMMNDKFYKTAMTLNNQPITSKILTKAFTVFT